MKIFVSTLLAILAISFGSANAALVTVETYTDSSNQYIDITGEIDKNTPDELQIVINNNSSVKSIRLKSPGGDVEAGWKLAKIIRDNKINTMVRSGKCASACTYAFMGGIERKFWKEDGKLGYHPASAEEFKGSSTINDIYDYGQSLGIKTARRFLRYVENGKEWQMILFLDRIYSKTSYKVMYWATADELVKAGIVTRVFELKVSEEVVEPVKPIKPVVNPDDFSILSAFHWELDQNYQIYIHIRGTVNTLYNCSLEYVTTGSSNYLFTITTEGHGEGIYETSPIFSIKPYKVFCNGDSKLFR